MRHSWKALCCVSAAAGITFAALSGTYISTLHSRIDGLEHRLASLRETTVDAAEGTGRAAILAEPAELRPIEPLPVEVEEAEPELQSLGTFKLTAYCPCPKCCGEWADGVTYTGTEATPGRTVAVDPDVIPLGSTLHINGSAYVAEDIGGAIRGNRIDVFFPDHKTALQFGVQYAEVEIQN